MRLVAKLALAALLALMLVPGAAYADGHDDGKRQVQSDDRGNDDDDESGRKKKPRFQTRFFSD